MKQSIVMFSILIISGTVPHKPKEIITIVCPTTTTCYDLKTYVAE